MKSWLVIDGDQRAIRSGLDPKSSHAYECPPNEEADWLDIVGTVAVVNETKKAEILAIRTANGEAAATRSKSKEDAKNRIKQIDWSKVKDVSDLTKIVKDLVERD